MSAATSGLAGPAPADITVRPPSPGDWPACRMLLPEAIPTIGARDYWLALARGSREIVAAVSVEDNGAALDGLRLHVVAPHRRRGVGFALLQRVFAEAAARGRDEVMAYTEPARDAAGEALLTAAGFAPVRSFTTVEGDLEAVAALVATAERGQARMDPGARIEPISAATVRAAGRLYAEFIAHAPAPVAARALLSLDLARFCLSHVLLAEGELRALLLIEREGDTVVLHARIVAPAGRGGRAALLLLARAARACQAAGVRRFRFQFLDSAADTQKMARRLGLQTVALARQWSRSGLAAPPANSPTDGRL